VSVNADDERVCIKAKIGDTGRQRQLESKAVLLTLEMKLFAAEPCAKEVLNATTNLEGGKGGK
jgi:hypothetical protein